jgi:hypothetical protein
VIPRLAAWILLVGACIGCGAQTGSRPVTPSEPADPLLLGHWAAHLDAPSEDIEDGAHSEVRWATVLPVDEHVQVVLARAVRSELESPILTNRVATVGGSRILSVGLNVYLDPFEQHHFAFARARWRRDGLLELRLLSEHAEDVGELWQDAEPRERIAPHLDRESAWMPPELYRRVPEGPSPFARKEQFLPPLFVDDSLVVTILDLEAVRPGWRFDPRLGVLDGEPGRAAEGRSCDETVSYRHPHDDRSGDDAAGHLLESWFSRHPSESGAREAMELSLTGWLDSRWGKTSEIRWTDPAVHAMDRVDLFAGRTLIGHAVAGRSGRCAFGLRVVGIPLTDRELRDLMGAVLERAERCEDLQLVAPEPEF